MSIQTSEMAELERLRAENARLLALLNRPVPKSEWQKLVEENAGLRADKLALLQMLSNVKGIRSYLGWDAVKREHVPTLTLTFSPTPPGDPTKHKGWRDCEEFEATINESVSKQAMQELVDQAQELDMGYGASPQQIPDTQRPSTPVGWSDTDWLAHLERRQQEIEIPYVKGPLPERGWD